MKNFFSVIAAVCFLLSPEFFYTEDPVGWKELKEAIENTPINRVTELQGKTFTLEVPGGTENYSLTVKPIEAFRVERLGTNQFQVIIEDAEALVYRGAISNFKTLEWQLNRKDPFKPQIIGDSDCTYTITFSQVGVGEIDLRKFSADEFDITYELSNPQSVKSVTQEGSGYKILRERNSTSDSGIKIRIKSKDGEFDLETGYVKIPACTTQSETQISTPSTNPDLPQANPADQMEIKYEPTSFCESESGLYCTTLRVTARNTDSRKVNCDEITLYMKDGNNVVAQETVYIYLYGGQSHTFDVILKAPYKPEGQWNYSYSKNGCYFN